MLCFLQTVGSEVERGKAGSVSARTVLSPKSSIWLVSPASLMGREWSLQNERGGMKGKSLLVAARGQGRVWWGINSPFTATPHTTSSLIPKLSFFFFFFFLKIAGLQQSFILHVYKHQFSNTIYSLHVSMSHFGNSCNILNSLIIIFIRVVCDQWSLMLPLPKNYYLLKSQMMVNISEK